MKPLDWREKQPVVYCVPAWQRDEQIKHACAQVSGRLQDPGITRTEPVAVVGYGPSLQDTWEQVRGFRYVISCSGSHRFLIDRGIIPTWHVEVDPRAHKVDLLGPPHPDVEYLIASACHPKVFDHLAGMNVKLWHVFDVSADGVRLLPPGDWAITGGCDVGLRALTIAAFLGFRDVQVFGLDGCGRASSHAGAHPHTITKYQPCEYEGVTYQTTPALLEAARSVRHELDQMPGVQVTFHGEGLIQHMTRGYLPQPDSTKALTGTLAARRPELISAPYRALNAQLHQDNLGYGVGGGHYAPIVEKLLAKGQGTLRSVLDYGCGKGYLAHALSFPIWEYDPAIPGKDTSPRPADLVMCTDVLEHIEPDKLGAVLADLARCVQQVGYLVIHTGPAAKTLADGRNAHLIQQPRAWWEQQLGVYFRVSVVREVGPLLHVVVSRKVKAKAA